MQVAEVAACRAHLRVAPLAQERDGGALAFLEPLAILKKQRAQVGAGDRRVGGACLLEPSRGFRSVPGQPAPTVAGT